MTNYRMYKVKVPARNAKEEWYRELYHSDWEIPSILFGIIFLVIGTLVTIVNVVQNSPMRLWLLIFPLAGLAMLRVGHRIYYSEKTVEVPTGTVNSLEDAVFEWKRIPLPRRNEKAVRDLLDAAFKVAEELPEGEAKKAIQARKNLLMKIADALAISREAGRSDEPDLAEGRVYLDGILMASGKQPSE